MISAIAFQPLYSHAYAVSYQFLAEFHSIDEYRTDMIEIGHNSRDSHVGFIRESGPTVSNITLRYC